MQVQRIVDYNRAGEESADEDSCKLIHWRPLKSGCVFEDVLGSPASPLRFDRPLPGAHPEDLTFASRCGEQQLKYVEDGRLLRPLRIPAIAHAAAAPSA
ncbi:hypothetical protein ABTZ78_11520 [Streptomyces bauhiniae]|uniref:hypothetical protein n=1 Tax=Streptomyces bauhiniae TaxID=2340725 RepID=UPI00331CF05F